MGRFISRPNRFIAKVEVNGREETVHVKNTGRCRELLVTGCEVYLSESDNPDRKTRYDLIAVLKNGTLLINMDSQAPNHAVKEWLLSGGIFGIGADVRSEVRYGGSRFDFYVEKDGKRAFIEVKGVTLENGGIAMFPDAPTERGVKHIRELMKCIDDGYEAYLLFVVQMKGVREVRPNYATHREFGEALKEAAAKSVKIMAVDCIVTPDSISIDAPVRVELCEEYLHIIPIDLK